MENYSRVVQLQRFGFSYWMTKSKMLPVNGRLNAKAEGVMEYHNPKKEMGELARDLEYSKTEGCKISWKQAVVGTLLLSGQPEC